MDQLLERLALLVIHVCSFETIQMEIRGSLKCLKAEGRCREEQIELTCSAVLYIHVLAEEKLTRRKPFVQGVSACAVYD